MPSRLYAASGMANFLQFTTVKERTKKNEKNASGATCASPYCQEKTIMDSTQAPPAHATGLRAFVFIICIYSNQATRAKNNIPAAKTTPPCQKIYRATGVAAKAVNIRVPSTIPPIFGALGRQNDDHVFENHKLPGENGLE